MRALVMLFSILAAGLLAFFVLPLLFVVVGIALVAVIVLVFLGPYLMKLPWFRDRIHVYRYTGGGRPYQPDAGSETQHERRLDHGDVIDVEGRELPPDEAEKRD